MRSQNAWSQSNSCDALLCNRATHVTLCSATVLHAVRERLVRELLMDPIAAYESGWFQVSALKILYVESQSYEYRVRILLDSEDG
mmetsp:Transcript_2726/g.4158  ORF Transcript_2726/g.4158 Transcript_2726/m.4158 type:complete len:85 (+) Transcript_2726:2560-2814(+)